MSLANCMRCGKVFSSNGISPYCPACFVQEDMDFKKIKEYLCLYPGANIVQVAQELDIPLKMIKHYLREGRLEITGVKNFYLECEKCGASIRTGRFCENCSRQMSVNISSGLSTSREPSAKMRHINRKFGYRA